MVDDFLISPMRYQNVYNLRLARVHGVMQRGITVKILRVGLHAPGEQKMHHLLVRVYDCQSDKTVALRIEHVFVFFGALGETS